MSPAKYAQRRSAPLASQLPWWAFVDDAIVDVDLQVWGGYEVTGIDSDCLADESANGVSNALRTLINLAPEGSCLHWYVEVGSDYSDLLEQYRASVASDNELLSELSATKIESLSSRDDLRRVRIFLFASPANPYFRGGFKRPGTPRKLMPASTKAEHDRQIRNLGQLLTSIESALKPIGASCRRLSSRDLSELCYRSINPAQSRLTPAPRVSNDGPHSGDVSPELIGKYPFLAETIAREQLAFAGCEVDKTTFELDGIHHRVITLKTLPDATVPTVIVPLLSNLSFSYTLSVGIQVLEGERAYRELKFKRNLALSMRGGAKRHIEAEQQQDEIESLMGDLAKAALRVVGLSCGVTLRADTLEELEDQTDDVMRAFAACNSARGATEYLSQLDAFLTLIPGGAHDSFRSLSCTSNNAADFCPVWQSWQGSNRPLCLIESRRSELVGLDPFDPDLAAYNALVIGSTGSGKSFTTNYLLANFLAAGGNCVIVDVGGSYRRLVELLDGDYLTINLDEDRSLNPFFPRDRIRREDGELDDAKVRYLSSLAEKMVAEAGEAGLKRIPAGLLDQAVRKLYESQAGGTPVLGDLQAVLEGMARDLSDEDDRQHVRDLAKKLKVWTEGPYARLINRPSSIVLKGGVAAFDLKGIESVPDLQSVVLSILAGIIWDAAEQTSGNTLIVFDEVWTLLSDPVSARLIEELYRTLRKYGAGILSISQSVNDFLSSPASAAIMNNSIVRYLLRHEQGHDQVAEAFGLNDRELSLFRQLNMVKGQYSEILVHFGNRHFVGRVRPTPLEYWIATTDGRDKELESELRARSPNASKAEILKALARNFPRGAR